MRAVIEIILPMIEELFVTGIGENICRYYCGAGRREEDKLFMTELS